MKLENCGTCLRPLGNFKAFIVRPSAAVSRISTVPPIHPDCAIDWAEKVKPKSKRHDPGVVLIWVTLHFQEYEDEGKKILDLGLCEYVRWFNGGRAATRQEVMDAVNAGIPELEKMCQNEDDRYELERRKKIAVALYPEA